MDDLSTAIGGNPAPVEAPAEVTHYIDPQAVAPAGSGLFSSLTSSLALAQGKLPLGGVRNIGRQAALKLGASPDTASTVTVWLPLVVLVSVVAVVVGFAYKGGKFFGKRSIKL